MAPSVAAAFDYLDEFHVGYEGNITMSMINPDDYDHDMPWGGWVVVVILAVFVLIAIYATCLDVMKMSYVNVNP